MSNSKLHERKRRSGQPWRKWYKTKAWLTIRATRLSIDPLCSMCLPGRVTAAAVVDHINPHRGDYDLFHDFENTQSLCKRCHDSTKQRIEKSGEIGCDVDGIPINPAHPWVD